MANRAGRKYGIGPPDFTPLERTPTQKEFFFFEGKLYRMLRQDRAQDLLSAWDFEAERISDFVLSDVKRKMKNAYDTVEVAKLVNRHRATVQQYVIDEKINSPVRIYERGKNARGKPYSKMKWSEEDIIALHDYLLTIGVGRPRKDGILYSGPRLPSRKELLAMLRQQPLFYTRTASGDYVPVWSAYNEV